MSFGSLDRPRSSCHQCALLLLTVVGVLVTPQVDAQEKLSSQWRYTLEKPAGDWQQPDYNDTSWKSGEGGFGTHGTPAARIGTIWNTNDIWIRKTFNINQLPQNPGLMLHHDEGVEIFINGVEVLTRSGYSTDYEVIKIPAEKHDALRQGKNTLAVHCHQATGGQYIDVHFVDADNPAPLPSMRPFHSGLITQWGAELTAENAWTEYPRPQLKRNAWKNLNGNWDYAITSENMTKTPDDWEGEILVPFCLESKLGGVRKRLSEQEALWYRRQFEASPSPGRRNLLTFEAVDYRCEVFVNGTSAGTHQGGNTPFTIDITHALKSGSNELIVRVEDETEEWQLNGKQRRNPHGIFYTPVSGIWQTVWMEEVAESHLTDLTIHTDATTGTISLIPEIEGKSNVKSVRVVIKDGENEIAVVNGGTEKIHIAIENAKLWSPAEPHLYKLQISLLNEDGDVLDQVDSYAGIRTVGKTQDANGHWRMTLNGEIIFHWGPLDQGWWPDGLLTPPSDAGMLFDIEWLKAAGFNMIRKHIKIEPRRYYYHCDRLGMLVWQDHVSGGRNPEWTRMAPNPTDADWADEDHAQFMLELERMIDELESHPSIVVWVPFNEAWGQHRTVEVGKWTVKRDPSRIVNIASGGNFWQVGDIADHHSYPHPDFPLKQKRFDDYIKVVGEFGGHGYPVPGHLWDANRDNWGYGGLPKTEQEYKDRYVKSLQILNSLRHQGIAAGVYTQTTDVEGEINGLMTYDRKVIKIPAKDLNRLHQQLFTAP